MIDFNTDYFWGHQYLEALSDMDFVQSEMRNLGVLARWWQRLGYLFRVDDEIGTPLWYEYKEGGRDYLIIRTVLLYQRWLVETKPKLKAEWKASLDWEKDWKQCIRDEKEIMMVFKECEVEDG